MAPWIPSRASTARGSRARALRAARARAWLGSAALWIGCATAPPIGEVPLPEDVPTWPGARAVALEEIPRMGRQIAYRCDAEPAPVAEFYLTQLRQRGWQVFRASPSGPQPGDGSPIELSGRKGLRSLGVSVAPRRGGSEVQLLLLDAEPALPEPPAP